MARIVRVKHSELACNLPCVYYTWMRRDYWLTDSVENVVKLKHICRSFGHGARTILGYLSVLFDAMKFEIQILFWSQFQKYR